MHLPEKLFDPLKSASPGLTRAQFAMVEATLAFDDIFYTSEKGVSKVKKIESVWCTVP